uniref:Protein FAM33A n=1 Tax=Mastacembelus armatus TaxID=205130 RepID=A0A7N8WR81_9TELE
KFKSEADLEYIEKRLKLDFINNTTENGCSENPLMMLENLRAIKAKHTELCSQMKEITAAQKQSMDSIRNSLNSVMELMQHFQQTTDVEEFLSMYSPMLDLNVFYQQLQQHFMAPSERMKHLKMRISDANLRVLQQLSLVRLDRKGHVRIVM